LKKSTSRIASNTREEDRSSRRAPFFSLAAWFTSPPPSAGTGVMQKRRTYDDPRGISFRDALVGLVASIRRLSEGSGAAPEWLQSET